MWGLHTPVGNWQDSSLYSEQAKTTLKPQGKVGHTAYTGQPALGEATYSLSKAACCSPPFKGQGKGKPCISA